jgi:hypothetical protein
MSCAVAHIFADQANLDHDTLLGASGFLDLCPARLSVILDRTTDANGREVTGRLRRLESTVGKL